MPLIEISNLCRDWSSCHPNFRHRGHWGQCSWGPCSWWEFYWEGCKSGWSQRIWGIRVQGCAVTSAAKGYAVLVRLWHQSTTGMLKYTYTKASVTFGYKIIPNTDIVFSLDSTNLPNYFNLCTLKRIYFYLPSIVTKIRHKWIQTFCNFCESNKNFLPILYETWKGQTVEEFRS